MGSIINKEKIQQVLKAAQLNNEKATELYFTNELNISEATKAILEFKDFTMKKYCEMIELQISTIENLEKAFNQMQHMYNLEKQKNNDSFKNN